MNTTRRDYGRQAAYRAERLAFPQWNDVLLNQQEVLAAVDEIHRLYGDNKSTPKSEFIPSRNPSGAVAYSHQRRILFGSRGDRGISVFLIVHELAHVYTPHDVGHGPEWRRMYLSLVDAVIGSEEARRLAIAFAAEGVPADAAASTPVRKKETKPRRHFELQARYLLSTERNPKTGRNPDGSEFTWIQVQSVYSEWGPAPADLVVSSRERADLRKGYVFSFFDRQGRHVDYRLKEKES